MYNLSLFIFDLVVFPVTFVRLVLIYLWGSKYNISWLRCADVMMHADKPAFNMYNFDNVNTIQTDYVDAVKMPSCVSSVNTNNNNDIQILSGTTDSLTQLLLKTKNKIWNIE